MLVGQVMIDGWPIAHHVFEGNQRDSSTVASVLKDIEKGLVLAVWSLLAIGGW